MRAAILIFFLSQASIKISYNLLAKKTARSLRFIGTLDAFSVFIVLWSLANVIVIAYNVANKEAPAVRQD